MLPLRSYQRDAVDAVHAAWAKGVRRPAVVLPTGSGKTVVFAHLLREWLDVNRGRRALVLAHRDELIGQAVDKIHSVAPSLKVGVVKAQRNQTLSDVVVGSVQTLRNERRRKQLLNVGLVVVDECHHSSAKSYVDVLTHFGALGGDSAHAVGFTATMSRGDGMALGRVWEDVVYTRSIQEMITGGFLVRPRGVRVRVEDLNLAGVKRTRGDYSEGALGAALEESMAPQAAAKAYLEHAADRPGILFAPTVSSATAFRDAFEDLGITAGLVHGAMPTAERERTLKAFSAGDIQVLCNCMVLTEGTDLPLAACVVVARPTTHSGLYIQMVGRVLRPHQASGKTDALVLDIVGASARHALSAHIDLFGEEPNGDDDELPDDDDVDDADDLGSGEVTLDEVVGVDGPLVSEEVDLFHGSASAWVRTTGHGIWFLPAGDRYIAMVGGAVPGTWDVVSMHRYRRGDSRWVIRGVEDRSYAMAWAEADVTVAEQLTASRARVWRAKKPSDAQLRLAGQYGVAILPGMLSGEVSGLISVAMGTRRIDPHIAPYMI